MCHKYLENVSIFEFFGLLGRSLGSEAFAITQLTVARPCTPIILYEKQSSGSG
jgi:hypothetical protein